MKVAGVAAFAAMLIGATLLLTTCTGHSYFSANDPTPIQHIVFILKENRTFDNYFGGFQRADGAISGMTSSGQKVGLQELDDCDESTLCNSWNCSLQSMDEGKMNQFDLPTGNLDAYGKMSEQDLPSYWSYAHHFVLAITFFPQFTGPVSLIISSRLRPNQAA